MFGSGGTCFLLMFRGPGAFMSHVFVLTFGGFDVIRRSIRVHLGPRRLFAATIVAQHAFRIWWPYFQRLQLLLRSLPGCSLVF